MAIYLNIETHWDRNITVVGFRSEATGLDQLKELPKTGRSVTYNGHCFDLYVIRQCVSVNLLDQYESIDLNWVWQRNGITGGQKRIEVKLGISRETEGVDPLEAIQLWNR